MRGQRVEEQSVLFEAIAAALGHHQLGEDACAVDRDGTAEPDIDILERNGLAMRPLQPRQPFGIDSHARGQSDTGEIGIEIEHAPVL
jgi:hypothetical protein